MLKAVPNIFKNSFVDPTTSTTTTTTTTTAGNEDKILQSKQ